MEELGKALTNRCRAVRELPNKKQKKQEETRDRNTNSEQLEFECQLRTPTQGRIHELLNLGASSSQKLFQSLVTKQDLLLLREDMWPNHRTDRKGWWCRAWRQRSTDNARHAIDSRPQNSSPLHWHNALHVQKQEQRKNRHNLNYRTTRWA